jgi:hypothetical protein
MKTILLEIADDVYERAARHAAQRGTSVQKEAAEFLARYSVTADDEAIAVARTRMQELFQRIKGFRASPKIAREDLYERGSLR